MTLERLGEEQKEQMKSRLQYEDDRWAAYQNQALDSAGAGEVQYLLVGKNRTHKTAPPHMPDTEKGAGWRWRFIGWVEL